MIHLTQHTPHPDSKEMAHVFLTPGVLTFYDMWYKLWPYCANLSFVLSDSHRISCPNFDPAFSRADFLEDSQFYSINQQAHARISNSQIYWACSRRQQSAIQIITTNSNLSSATEMEFRYWSRNERCLHLPHANIRRQFLPLCTYSSFILRKW